MTPAQQQLVRDSFAKLAPIADFTPALKDAWTACYGVLADEMKAAGRQLA